MSDFLLWVQVRHSDSGWGRWGRKGDWELAPGLHLERPVTALTPSPPAPLFLCLFVWLRLSCSPHPFFSRWLLHPSSLFPQQQHGPLLQVPPPSPPSASCGPVALCWQPCARWSRTSALARSPWRRRLPTARSLAGLGAAARPALVPAEPPGRTEGSGPGRKGPTIGAQSLYEARGRGNSSRIVEMTTRRRGF